MYNPNKNLIKSTMLIIIAGWNLYAQGGKLSGFITDQKTGEALIGANAVSYTHLTLPTKA